MGGELAEDLLDRVADARDFPGELIEEEKAFETMSVVIVYGFGMFCDNQCQDDNGAGIIADVQIKWQNLYGKA